MNNFFKNYYLNFLKILKVDENLQKKLLLFSRLLLDCKERGGTVFFLGNGGSSAISSHVAVDLTKNAGIKSFTFNEVDLITCFSNDFGYEQWMQKSLNYYSTAKDLVVLISSSGNSKNILNAAKWSIKNNRKLVTFTGMLKNNLLNKINKNGLYFWVNSKEYNFIEMAHLFYLLSVVDLIIKRKK
jgi:D-sedoheptulose 7-phosphate isomerase